MLARSRSTVYVTDRFRVVALEARTGRRLWVSPRVDAGQEGYRNGIIALAASPSAVYVGGDFTRVGAVRRSAVAALDARDGHLLAWQTPPMRGDPRPYVTVLAASGARLYLGGTFAGASPR